MKRLLPAAALSLILSACMPAIPATPDSTSSASSHAASSSGLRTVTVELLGPRAVRWSVIAEVAETPDSQARGLMYRRELPDDAGMLFVFPDERNLSFWMKNTLIPLDIAFFDGNGNFVSAATMTPCEHDPCPNYHSESLARYALEVNAGALGAAGVTHGWTMQPLL